MSRPRVAVAAFQHETNTFAPFPTRWEDFQTPGFYPDYTLGEAVRARTAGSNTPIGGFLAAAEGRFETIPVVYAAAEPGGTVARDAFDRVAGVIAEGVAAAGPLDAVYLDLHGAMVTEDHDDGEAELLRRLREVVGPDLPVAVSLDLHGNLSEAFHERASCVSIYRTYPHVDMAETGARAAALLARLLERGRPFARAFRRLDYIVPITSQSTRREPGGRLYGMLPGLEGGPVASVDFAFGFPPADIPCCGMTVFAHAEGQAEADAAADAVAAALAEAEGAFADPLVPARDAVRRAMAAPAGAGPVVIADPQDNPGAGAPGDSTGLLAAMLAEGASGAIGMIWDPEAAASAHRAGVGARIAIPVGGRFAPGGPPVALEAEVEALSDGAFAYTGPMAGGLPGKLGPSACLRVTSHGGDLAVVIGSNRAQTLDRAIFTHIGVDPTALPIVAVKSAVHFLADFEPIAREVIFAAAPGANPCLLPEIPYRRLRPGLRLGPNGPAFRAP